MIDTTKLYTVMGTSFNVFDPDSRSQVTRKLEGSLLSVVKCHEIANTLQWLNIDGR